MLCCMFVIELLNMYMHYQNLKLLHPTSPPLELEVLFFFFFEFSLLSLTVGLPDSYIRLLHNKVNGVERKRELFKRGGFMP